jgi:uncharacterized protein
MRRHDYAFPFRIAAASGQGAQTGYSAHVDQMIRQVLLTSPGERADLPEFGCGVRQMLFAPLSDGLIATAKMRVQQALNKWLAGQIQVQDIQVEAPGDDAELLIQINYILIETQTNRQTSVRIL